MEQKDSDEMLTLSPGRSSRSPFPFEPYGWGDRLIVIVVKKSRLMLPIPSRPCLAASLILASEPGRVCTLVSIKARICFHREKKGKVSN